ncbi:hypothetical protein LWP59_27835 [Amycolatopsis acidiphila]|uniref:Uncharacterized protein n=1 Tax=Amycolatopsis acidiphila TaxID=715473 RepID=A0A557ZWQ5_9PSEU|nr:hypothetical protein [Amycolatopsis acidiphila]TVT16444.1 hypothetical protein FNH06_34600 [Amycolatopsis acidiphila]UIJ57925.1 hypothetical protein LWP59_27835 [Amycolatopsis acidiphila]GHG71078.1 hypothetical protein GCM10017788_32750 [Amycolatopsis acidiphila]
MKLRELEDQLRVPVLDGLQAQGDLIVIPLALVRTVRPDPWAAWRPVPPEGVELVRGETGNTHTLVADAGTHRWTAGLHDPLGLTIRLIENTAPAYLIHPEHGCSGVAPGCWLVRRQQEYRAWRRLVTD